MQNRETPPTNNTEINPTTGSENPWQRMAEEAPPFGGGEKQYSNTSETGKNTTESDDYYTFEGVEYRNIDKIDISTDQGKFEWIDSLVGNANTRLEDEQDNIIREEGLYGMDKKEQENQVSTSETQNDIQSTGWESVAAMANKYQKQNEAIDPAKFEKPSENFDTIASAVVEYTHCDLSKKKGFYDAVMTSSVERWYPGIRASQNPARDRFESARFEEWKNNIINMDAQTAIEKYGRGDTYNALKKIHNYLKSGQNASTQAELLRDCFNGDNDGFDAAFDHLRYDRHSEPGWMYYSSRDEKLGLEKRINADGRLYLNAEPGDTFDIADKFVNACKEAELPYEFKINQFPDRSDAMVFYIDNNDIGNYVEIISRILDENPKISQRVGKPPLLAEKATDKIGYGDETGGESYNERQCKKFQEVIEAVTNSYRGEALHGSTQERARFLYVNHYEKFVNTIKDRL